MTLRPRPRFLPLSGALLLAAASLAPVAAAAPANLARSDAGTRLTTFLAPAGSDANDADGAARAAQALLGEADPLGCALGAGTTTVVLTLPRAETLHRFDFLNLTAAGRVSVAVSTVALPAESPRWRSLPAAGGTFGAPNEVVACDLGHVEARHVKITFETRTPGRIDTFGLFGAGLAGDAAPAGTRPRFVAYAAGGGGLRVRRVSSGVGAPERIVDGSLGTGHAFAPSDHRPTALLDFNARRTLTRVNLACRTATPGRLDLYLFTKREDADAPLPPAGRSPDATARVEGRSGLSRVTIPLNAENVRLLAVVFVPDASGAAATVEAKDFKDARDYKDLARGADTPDARSSAPSRPPGTGTGDLPPEGPNVGLTPDGGFVLTEVTPVGPGLSGPGDTTFNVLLPPGTAASTLANPGGGSPLEIVPFLPPPVGNGVLTP